MIVMVIYSSAVCVCKPLRNVNVPVFPLDGVETVTRGFVILAPRIPLFCLYWTCHCNPFGRDDVRSILQSQPRLEHLQLVGR